MKPITQLPVNHKTTVTLDTITSQRVLDEVIRIAFADITSVIEIKSGKVTVVDTKAMSDEQRAVISGVEVDEDGRISVLFHDKVHALELLGRHLGLFPDVTAYEGAVALEIQPQSSKAGG